MVSRGTVGEGLGWGEGTSGWIDPSWRRRLKEDEFVDESVAIASGCARRDTWRREERAA
jgi:hypothetical protein